MVNFERFEMRLDPETAKKIDTWRNKNNANKTRAEAVRELVAIGYDAKDNDKLFEIMRLNILLNKEQFLNQYGEAYIFAWANRIYPLNHDYELHKPFASNFNMNEQNVMKLITFVDRHWLERRDFYNVSKSYPTLGLLGPSAAQGRLSFYDLEDAFINKNDKSFERMNIFFTLRYYFLQGLFDGYFWDGINSWNPSEAHGLIDAFNLENDICI